KSNITYRVSDGVGRWVVRRPPLGHVLATAHDMVREHRVISALSPTSVPVPTTLALCADPTVIGAPFYVMQLMPGTPYRQAHELAALGPERARAISNRLVEVLADLHAVSPAEVGLTDFGRPEGFLARQVQRWKKQLDASKSRTLPGADELFELLASSVPRDGAPGIVHGDYRLDNLLFDEDDRVTAVLDWEMATIGDPFTDVALMLAYHRMARLEAGAVIASASNAEGFLDEQAILDLYSQVSGRGLEDVGFYLGLAYFKLAGILEGIYFRYLEGQTVGPGFEQLGSLSEPLIQAGIDSCKGRDR
ncbi:MAG: phosphotransferase family protein, partial [Actinobacteria bacterium]|nr:phosphotransferase family protein [Actinomycetota bacterium]